MIGLWLRGAMVGRAGRTLGSVAGIALTVAFLASLGTFVASSTQTMTHRAIANVPIDWQVQLSQNANATAVVTAIHQSDEAALVRGVGYADTLGLSATVGGSTQSTGPGKVLGVESDYTARFPSQISLMLGSLDGALIASQTATNLHVAPGDTVSLQRVGLPPVDLVVAGVVNLPNADAMFAPIGVALGTAPQAPPDNVLIVPMAMWHTLFDAQRNARPDTVRTQLHVRLSRANLPSDPGTAYLQAVSLVSAVALKVPGDASFANNLAARLDAVRADALYARVLFLFLGAPGVVLALLVTLSVTASGADRRRREQSLLRIRGASAMTIVRLSAYEAAAVAVAGVLLGLLIAAFTARWLWGLTSLSLMAPWCALAAVLGVVLAVAAVVIPSWRLAHQTTVAAARMEFLEQGQPWWQRVFLDVALLGIGALVFWSVAQSGYNIVVATEGVSQASVHYEAFLGPLCLWIGAGLVWIRFGSFLLHHGISRIVSWVPGAGAMAPLTGASLSRQRSRIAAATALVALAFAFATATSIFNTTYDSQSRVDAVLTNGADVAVTGSSGAPAGALLEKLKTIPGVATAEPLMHRLAYVGSDLQDFYGVDAKRIGQVTSLANAYFANHDAVQTMDMLQRTHDGVLVSEETAKEFQLKLGDEINLRLQNATDHQYRPVRFHFVGIVKEFPSAPKDAFIVGNSDYLAEQTGQSVAEVVLLRTNGDAQTVGASARLIAEDAVAKLPGIKVTTLAETQASISSSLTAVDLHRLTRLELSFAVLLIAGIAGVMLGLNLAERKRNFVILAALGANPSQIGAFLWSEGLFTVLFGMLLGTGTGLGIAKTLVAILAGAFDPPPEALVVPWFYLAIAGLVALVCATLAILTMQKLASRPDLETLRAR